MKTTPSAHDLWTEYKVAAQFSKSWDEVEEMATLASQAKGMESPGPAPDVIREQDGTWRQTPKTSIGSAQYWMQQVDIPPWFYHDELGLGTDTTFYGTQERGPILNRRNIEAYLEMLEKLAKARKVISRTVKM